MITSKADYQTLPYVIPNLDGDDETAFDNFNEREEEKRLRELFGDLLYEAFVSGIEELPDEWVATNGLGYALDALVVYGSNIWKSLQANNLNHIPAENAFWTKEPDNRWLKLREGDNYSPIANRPNKWIGLAHAYGALVPYIYSQWVIRGASTNTSTGIVVADNANSTTEGAREEVINSYNDFARKVGDEGDTRNTLYGYLYYSGDTYQDIIEEGYHDIREYLCVNYNSPDRKNFLDL